MKPYLTLIFLFLFTNSSFSQNHVYNGSFEIRDSIFQNSYQKYYSCPFKQGKGINAYNPQLPMAKGWNEPAGIYYFNYQGQQYENYSTSDFYHSCGNDNTYIPPYTSELPAQVGVPYSKWLVGYQYPRTGEGFAGFLFYNRKLDYTQIDYGEYIQTKLTKNLQKDTIYKCIFYLVRDNLTGLSIETQGAYFSKNKIEFPDLLNGLKDSLVVAQVINNQGYIDDTLNWIKIEGVFKASGDEAYITLGSFDVHKHLGHIADPTVYYNTWAAYAIDDISVYPISAHIDSARCGNDTLICLGNNIKLGKSNIEPEYKSEYSFEWYIKGEEDSLFSYEEHPVVSPDSNTTYIVNVIDFKFDKSTDTITVNVLDCSEPTDLIVYPNPSYSIINFKFNSPIPNNMSIEIYDIAGRIIKKKDFAQNYESKEVQLDLSPFASGMYFYSVIINNEKSFNGKIIHLK